MSTFQTSPWILCVACSTPMNVDAAIGIQKALLGEGTVCLGCGRQVDWWATLVKAVEENFMMSNALVAVGAQQTVIETRLQKDDVVSLAFSEHGVPADARLLHVNYTVQDETNADGFLMPLEMHGNVPIRHFIRRKVNLAGFARGTKPPDRVRLFVMVTWVPATESDESWHALVDAFEYYVTDRYTRTIVPANAAVEAVLRGTIVDFLEATPTVDGRNIERCMRDCGHSNLLDVLAPALVSLVAGAPSLPHEIKGQLDKLNTLRNAIAHGGKRGKRIALVKADAAKLMTAAVFGFHYFRRVREWLMRDRPRADPAAAGAVDVLPSR